MSVAVVLTATSATDQSPGPPRCDLVRHVRERLVVLPAGVVGRLGDGVAGDVRVRPAGPAQPGAAAAVAPRVVLAARWPTSTAPRRRSRGRPGPSSRAVEDTGHLRCAVPSGPAAPRRAAPWRARCCRGRRWSSAEAHPARLGVAGQQRGADLGDVRRRRTCARGQPARRRSHRLVGPDVGRTGAPDRDRARALRAPGPRDVDQALDGGARRDVPEVAGHRAAVRGRACTRRSATPPSSSAALGATGRLSVATGAAASAPRDRHGEPAVPAPSGRAGRSGRSPPSASTGAVDGDRDAERRGRRRRRAPAQTR